MLRSTMGLSVYIYFITLQISCFSERKTSEIIPEDYNRDMVPIVNNSPVSVYVTNQIIGIDNIKEASMDFRLIIYMICVWKDPRLNLKHLISDYPVILPSYEFSKIWKPVFSFPNTKNIEKFNEDFGIYIVKVLTDGSLYGVIRLNFLVDCPMKLHYYPMDVQTCNFLISSAANSEKEAILKWMGEDSSPYKHFGKSIHIRRLNLLQFEIGDIKVSNYTGRWVSGNFTVLKASFTFIRRLTGNIMNVYIPSTLVVMLSWLSFWFDVKASPARITLGVTSILTLVTQIVQSRSFMPPVDYLKALDIWFIFCTALVFFSLVEYAMAYSLENSKPKENKNESRLQQFQSDAKKDKDSKMMKIFISYLRNKTLKFIGAFDANVYDKVSRFLFPFVFIAFVNCYWAYYLYNRNE